jgi:hypothetical protein
MNQALRSKIEPLEDFLKNTDQVILGLVKGDEDLVLDLNRDEQLYDEGQDATGRPITPRYTPFTVSIKRLKGQPTDRVTLKDTGAFYRSFDINYGPDYFEIVSKDRKTRKLQKKYGDQILGLDPDSLQLIIDLYRDELTEYLRKKLAV